jgi:acyl-CoA dehydrogenase
MLAQLFAHARILRIADGPDEVHRMAIARREIATWTAPAAAVVG